MASKYSNMTVKAFRRENGRVGVRNHVVILPVDDISNACLLYTSPSPRDYAASRMPSSA